MPPKRSRLTREAPIAAGKRATLGDWLEFVQSCHPSAIELGLERVTAVHCRLGSPRPAPIVIVVGGTNGKGSCVALLESILTAAGFRVGAYTSPHLLRFNERLRIDRQDSSDCQWVEAFQRIEQLRGSDPLTYFEFATLAAVSILAVSGVDVALLEIGLGGRLDAVNAIPANAALISSIDLDHADWLGTDRQSIGGEKAGIYHHDQIAVCGDCDPPRSVPGRAREIGARYFQAGRDFCAIPGPAGWTWRAAGRSLADLPAPNLAGRFQVDNAAACLMVLAELGLLERISESQVRRGLQQVRLPGRLQSLGDSPELIIDVGHNPAAASAIAGWLAENPAAGDLHLVLGMLKTKDAAGFVLPLMPLVDHWYPSSLPVAQGMTAADLAACLPPPAHITGGFERVEEALGRALELSGPRDRILVLGSFHTAAAGLRYFQDNGRRAEKRPQGAAYVSV